MARKTKRPLYVTPVGIAVWPHVHSPDTKFDKDGVYRVQLAYDEDSTEAKKLIAAIDAWIESAITEQRALDLEEAGSDERARKRITNKEYKRADKPYKMELNDEGEETGRVLFNFKLKAKGKTREGEVFERKVALYLKGGQPLPKDKKIGGGSKLQVSYEANPFYTGGLGAGVSLRMMAVMVHELVEWAQRDASGFGFDVDPDAETPGVSTDTESEKGSEGGDEGEDDGDF
jgi:hypothetical protein